jgi:hypothetical protein
MKYKIAGILLLTFGLFSSVQAATTKNVPIKPTDNQWHFLIAPYAWLPWITGNMTVRGNNAAVDVTPNDLIKKLDFVLQLHAEAAKGNWAFMVDPNYIKLSDSTSESGPSGVTVGGNIKFKMTLVDFGVYYKFLNKQVNDRPDSSVSLEGLLGGRYMYLKNTISPMRFPSVIASKSWTDPIIGGRLQYHINKFWSAVATGDIGGFGVGSHFTWAARLLGIYNINKTFGLAFGVRALGVNYSDGAGNNRFKMDTTMYGPIIGLTIRF